MGLPEVEHAIGDDVEKHRQAREGFLGPALRLPADGAANRAREPLGDCEITVIHDLAALQADVADGREHVPSSRIDRETDGVVAREKVVEPVPALGICARSLLTLVIRA